MTVLLFSGILTGGLRVIVCFFLFSKLLWVEKPGRRSIFIGLAGAAAIALFLHVTNAADFYRMALEAVWITVCVRRLQKADARMGLFISIFYEIAVFFWQFLLMACLGVLFRSPEFLDYGSPNGQAAVWLLHLLLVLSAVCLSRTPNLAQKGALRLASGAALAGFVLVITLSEQTVLSISPDTLTMWTVLSVVLMMSVLVFNMNRQYEVEKELAGLKAQQAELLERDYTKLNNIYAANAKLFHDFHNHIGALRRLLSGGKYAEAIQYLDELQAPVRELADTVWTGDETADYLINSKAASAAAEGIPLQVQVEFPRHTNIRSVDLCAILGNLLDNALEAVRQVPAPGQRFIGLTVRRINQMIVIKVENSLSVLPLEEKGTLKTTKTESGLHGWGLKSAQTAAEKYDGMVRTTFLDHTFLTVVTLSYHGVEMEKTV